MDVEKVRAALRKINDAAYTDAPGKAEDEEPSWGAVVVFESIFRDDFREWLDRHEGEPWRWTYEPITPASGHVVVYNLTSRTHMHTAGWVITRIMSQLVTWGGVDILDTLIPTNAVTVDVGDRDQEPNQSLTRAGLDWPTLVLEVAFKNESRALLEAKLLRWMRPNTTVQVAIGIKIFHNQRRLAILHARGGATQGVEFGADASVQPPPTLAFPLQALYVGAAIPATLSAHVNDNIVIDLVKIRTVIDEYVVRHRLCS